MLTQPTISQALEDLVFHKKEPNNTILTFNPEDEEFYWVFYAGQGCYDYHEVTKRDGGYIHASINFKRLKITEEEVLVPAVYKGLKIIPL